MDNKNWYDNKVLVHILLIIFFPVGLYTLWKTDIIAKWWKITATGIIALTIIANAANRKGSGNQKELVATTVKVEMSQAEKDSIAAVERLDLIAFRKRATITAPNLLHAYLENEVKADNLYKEKRFFIEGHIKDISKDLMGNIYVTLKAGDPIRSVQCFINSQEVANLHKGEKITVEGDCKGMLMNVLIKDCNLITNLNDI
jgi:hypothetical protein